MASAPYIMTPVSAAEAERGDGVIVTQFLEGYCRVTKDGWNCKAGQLLKLRPWQRSLDGAVYARRSDGVRKHRQALIGLPRKNGKSAIGSGLGLHGLLMSGEGAEVYSCAADKDQARIVFGVAKRMVELDEQLSELVTPYRDALEIKSTGSIYKALSSEAFTKEGLNPNVVIFDELHASPTDELYQVMSLAQDARKDPLLIAITTAGQMGDQTGRDSICYRLYQYGEQIASGEIDDPTFFLAWWGVPLDANPADPKVWEAANPMYGDLIDPEGIAAAYRRAERNGTINDFKALDVNTPILTEHGWRALRDVRAGDRVYAIDGSRTEVVGESPVFENRPCYEVVLSDGRTLVADDQHRWLVERYHKPSCTRTWMYVSTGQLLTNGTSTDYIPCGGPVETPRCELPIDPYILGYWLGDGDKNGATFAVSSWDADHLMAIAASAGYDLHSWDGRGNTRRVYLRKDRTGQSFRLQLTNLRVRNDKHVPDVYLTASAEQRLSLLQGLMDSDGTPADGRPRFTNTNKNLVDAVVFLARSLGWKPATSDKVNKFGKFWNVAWTCTGDINPFRLPRKAGRVIRSKTYAATSVKILSVGRVAPRPTKCIAVSHPSQTFLAGSGLLATANTKRLNMWVNQAQAWLSAGAWGKCSSERAFTPNAKGVVLGFDGSRNGDCTALVAVTVDPQPQVKVLGLWERPSGKQGDAWRVPRAEVKDAVRQACRDYHVREVAWDEFLWLDAAEELTDEGIPVVTFPQTMARMGPATQRFYEMTHNCSLAHDGDPRLARHLNNAKTKTDARGTRLMKDAPNSPRKIDLAVASVMALERAAYWLLQPADDTWNGVPISQIGFVW